MAKRLLEVENLKTYFRSQGQVFRAIDDVSLHVDENETLGIVGESGSGKSTLGLSILRLVPAARNPFIAGRILFDGRDLLALSEREMRSVRGGEISMILQDPMTSLNPVFTLGAQIEEAIHAHKKTGMQNARAAAIEALRQVRIAAPETRVDSYPHQISGGMRQRVVGAIAIASQPRLLIADEPTTSLDVTLQAQYLQLLKDLRAAHGMSLILITHDFGVVARMCDRVAVMYAGSIVETAPVREIFRQPRHWYTAALLASMPKLDHPRGHLPTIEGAPPRLNDLPLGCKFAPRCVQAQSICFTQMPERQSISPDHDIKCWYPRGAA